jgi:Fe-S oxidoreductase/nitrate reductase gamma subunit
MDLTRETFGNIPSSSQALFYLLAMASVAVFAWGIWRRVKLWRMGAGHWSLVGLRQVWKRAQPRLRRLLVEGLLQKRVLGRGLASRAHILLFAGFVVLFIGTTLLSIDHVVTMIAPSLRFHRGLYYQVYEFTMDVFGVAFLVGCVLFAWRRAGLRPLPNQNPPSVGHKASDWVVLALFMAIGVTGFLLEALRISWWQPSLAAVICSPVGFAVSQGFSAMSIESAHSAHFVMWWVHVVLVFTFIAVIPFTRLMHFVTGALNIFFVDKVEMGTLTPVSLEQVEETGRIGVSEITHFTPQQLLSLDACMECGRCQDACPATATNKPLSPKEVVQDLKSLMPLIPHPSSLISAETLWSCTACSACVNVCPVRIDPLTLILDMRRNLVGEGGLSGTAATALRRMQSSANPWGLPPAERANWAEGLNVPTMAELQKQGRDGDSTLLYWVGCAGSYDRRAQRVARAVVKILQHAGVNFAILGREEKCNGESARRVGDEFLFQELAQANVETLGKYDVCKILTHCPHCLNTFRKDYPQFGGQYEVAHHTEFIGQLLKEGKLRVEGSGLRVDGAVTFHDPCYLARVNNIHDAPREVLRAVAHACSVPADRMSALREMPRNRTNTFCCGAGGGRMWFEEDPRQRVSTLRAQEALATGAKTIAVGCPFCLTMMTDGVAAQDDEARVMDVAEILAETLETTREP